MPAVDIPEDLTKCLINGKRVGTGKTFRLLNPANGKLTAEVHEAGAKQVEEAVQAAKIAQEKWEYTSATARVKIMQKWAALIRQNIDQLARIEAVSMGRPVQHYFDGESAASNIEYIASLAANHHGETSLNTPGFLNMTFRQPYGITAGIIPWNVPAIMVSMKAAPAVAAGNAIIIKTSEKAPLTPSFVIGLAKEAGFPDGLIQAVHGLGQTGAMLAEHMEIRKVSFTGSTATGRKVMAAAANSNVKACSLELGGKSPSIIFDDADLDEAVPAVTFAISWNSGQVCIANSRIYCHEKVYDDFCTKFSKAFQQFTHGDPTDPATNMGPQADSIQAGIVRKYLEIGKSEGKVLIGGEPGEGNYIKPTIFTDVPETARINKEEIFGPVTIVHKFSDEDDVISKANDTNYGLYAAVFSKNIDRALRVARRLQAGSVGVNCASPTHATDMPFGGSKQSGHGKEMGLNALLHWSEEKAVIVKTSGF